MTIEWTVKAIRDTRRLVTRDRERVIAKIEQYAENPTSLARQVIALTGGNNRRLRVGSYRVVFKVEQHGDITTMVVLRVQHRSKAYD